MTKITGANISVKLTDKFINAANNNEDYILRYPIDITDEEVSNLNLKLEYDVLTKISTTEHKYVKKIKAKKCRIKLSIVH